jgi:MFS family permease
MSSLDRNEKAIDEKGLDGYTTTRVVAIDDIPYEEKCDGKHHLHAGTGQVDAAAALAAKAVGHQLDPVLAKKLLRKIDKNLLPLMMVLYMMQFVDKTTLGSSSILGIKTDTHLTTTEYNLLGSLFYIAYLAFEWPQNIALQRFPVGKWMSFNITLWAIFLCCFAACKNFAGLAILRFGLGMCEGSITAGFMIVTSMFYTLNEQAIRTGYWFLMNGTAQVISGLLSFGVLQIGLDASFKPWRIFFLLTGAMTLVVAAAYWIWFPDNPMNAKFLTEDEKVMAIERIRENKTGVENKTWKKEQWVALPIPK